MITEFFAEVYATNEPITVIVGDFKWYAIGPETVRTAFLIGLLQFMGGINQNVPAGVYLFNMKSNWFQTFVTFEPDES